jgi:hypothetical protein
MKLDKYIMVSEPISAAYFINHSSQSMCLYVYVAKQQLDKNFTAAMNTHARIEELLDTSFSVRSVSYKGKHANNSPQNSLLICNKKVKTWRGNKEGRPEVYNRNIK